MTRKVVTLILISIFINLFPTLANAHVSLESSIPSDQSELDYSPESIMVTFTQAIDVNLSTIRVVDETGAEVPTAIRSESDQQLIAELPSLENGIYHVHWKALALDTHVTEGSFQFSVEMVDLNEEEDIVESIPADLEKIEEEITSIDQDEPNLTYHIETNYDVTTYVRMIEVFIALAMAGLIFYCFLIKMKTPKRDVLERVTYIVVALIFIITGFIQLFARSLLFDHLPLNELFLNFLTTTSLGITSISKVAIIILMLVFTFYKGKGQLFFRSVLFISLFLCFALSSHAEESYLSLLSHTLHMGAASIWLGGMIGFTVQSFIAKKDGATLTFLHERLTIFSKWAFLSMILIVASGFILSVTYLNSWNELVNSNYGIVLLWKIASFSPILIIAGFHRFLWLPKLQKGATNTINRLYWGLRIELILALIVIVLAGFLSSTPPPINM